MLICGVFCCRLFGFMFLMFVWVFFLMWSIFLSFDFVFVFFFGDYVKEVFGCFMWCGCFVKCLGVLLM